MKIFNDRNTFFFISITLLVIIVFKFYNLGYGLDSIFDEGFLLLGLSSSNYEGISQSMDIINFAFGGKNNYDLFDLKLARLIIQLISTTFFSISSVIILEKIFGVFDKKRKRVFILFIFLFSILSLDSYSSIISYNQLMQFLTLISLSLFFRYYYCDNFLIRFFLLLFVGVFDLLAILNVLSSGFILSGFIIVFVLLKKESIYFKIIDLLIILAGIILCALFYNYFVKDFKIIYSDVYYSIIKITKSGRGYEKEGQLNLIYNYFKYLFTATLYFSVISFVYIKFINNKKIIIKLFTIFLFLIIQFLIWENFYAIFLFPFFYFLFEFKNNTKKNLIIDKVKFLILFLLPISLSLGTNTDLYSKSLFFISIWGFLILYIVLLSNTNFSIHVFSYILVTILFITQIKIFFEQKNTNGNFLTSRYYMSNSKISNIGIRKEQINYFKKINSILQKYKFNINDVILSFQLDHATIYVLNSKFYGPYFQPTDFLNDSKRFNFYRPKFIFLNKYEYETIKNDKSVLSWNFPNNYDKYYVGSPEIFHTPYSTKRWLFCLKNNNNNNYDNTK